MNKTYDINDIPDWEDWYLRGCYWVASKSKDTSTKIGAILTVDNRIISTGYNGIPIGVRDLNERQERPIKYSFFEHAERNCIFSAAKHGISTNNSIMYVNMYPCVDCARAIIQSGISTVIIHKPFVDLTINNHSTNSAVNLYTDDEKNEFTSQWIRDLSISKKLFEESNIKVKQNTNYLNCAGLSGGKYVII